MSMLKGLKGAVVLLAMMPAAVLGLVSNGFDSDYVYVLEGGANAPTDRLQRHLKTTQVTTDDPWISQGTPTGTATSGTFTAQFFTSLAFSNAQRAGVNTPAGYRLFYLGKNTNGATGATVGVPIILEVDSNNVKLREFYVGRAVNGNADFGGTSVSSFPLANLRYNARNNTLMVGIAHNGIGTGGTMHLYLYELSLPDSPAGTGVGSPQELQGVTLMETYDTGITGADATNYSGTGATQTGGGGVNLNVSPDGAVFFRNQLTDVFMFPSTAGGYTPGGTTTGPTTPPGLTNVALNAKTATLGLAQIGTEGQWQSVLYRPADNSLINLQRKVAIGSPVPVILSYDMTTQALTLVGTTGTGTTTNDAVRGQHNESLDTGTGDIWIAAQSLPGSGNGGAWKYAADGTLTKWDTLGAGLGLQLFDIAVPPSGSGACCLPGGGGCVADMSKLVCAVEAGGVWQGAASTCTATTCVEGACCQAGGICSSKTQADCAADNGYWQGPNTTCGQFPCPTGACCKPCGVCTQGLASECTGGGVFGGAFSVCGEVICPSNLCAVPPVDGDCDGDVDLNDLGIFQRCYNPAGPIPSDPTNCACFDRVAPAGEIDDLDFDAFVDCAQGSRDGVAAGAPCP